MPKQRSVRLHYPADFVELARALDTECDRRDIATALSLPLSTVYRWVSPRSTANAQLDAGWSQTFDVHTARYFDRLIAGCEKAGFEIRKNVQRLIPKVFGESPRESAAAFEGGPYNFLGELPNQIVIGQLSFPRGATGSMQSNADVLAMTNGAPATQSRKQVLLAKMEIDQHYYTRLSCDALARIVGMTKFNFIKAFKAAFSVSPYQYLNQVRVDHAKHMLALTDQPLRLIAASVGFTSASSLARAFKRFAGASPANLIHKVAPAARKQPATASL